MCQRLEQRGARRPGARALAWRLHHENPCKIGRLRRYYRLRPDRRRSLRRGVTSTSCSTSAPTFSRAPSSATKATPARPIAKRRGRAASLPSFRTRPTKRTSRPSSPGTLYKARARIEQGVGRLKRFKRVALRCEKTARNFRSIVSFAAGLCLIKFVHTHSRCTEVWTVSSSTEDWESLGWTKNLNAARDARGAPDEAAAFKGEHHLMHAGGETWKCRCMSASAGGWRKIRL